MIGANEYGSGEKKCLSVSSRPQDVTTQRTVTIIGQAVRLSHLVADGNSVFVSGGELLAGMTDRTLLDCHSLACNFILSTSISIDQYLCVRGRGSMLRISECIPINSSRDPGILYQSVQVYNRIVCSNQMVTSSLFIFSQP